MSEAIEKKELPYDTVAYREWLSVDLKREEYWSNEGHTILEEKSPELLNKLFKILDRVDILIAVKNKNRSQKKAWRDTLREYAETCRACIRYMRIHLRRET